MSRPLLLFLATLLIFSATSCGPNAEEKARIEQAKVDSIKSATEAEMKQKFAIKESLQNSLRIAEANVQTLNNNLAITKANLEVANDEMSKTKEFHMFRTDAEREQQIREASLKVQNIQASIADIEEAINTENMKIAKLKEDLTQYQ